MLILFLSTAHSLSQRAILELMDIGHDVYVQIANNDHVMEEAVKRYKSLR